MQRKCKQTSLVLQTFLKSFYDESFNFVTEPAMQFVSRFFLLAALSAFAGLATAGPLRDRIEARRAEAAGVRVVRDLAYGSDPAQRFDVYIPKGAAGAPVIFMVHGGAWKNGDKGAASVVRNKVAFWGARGFIVVSANYRMLPAADPVQQGRDVASALVTAQGMAQGWGGDRNKFILMGHSAGAHLVALVAASAPPAGASRWLGTVALDSAAMDVEYLMAGRHRSLHDEAFGSDKAFWLAASPYGQLAGPVQPFMLVCSTQRSDACPQSERFAAKARQLGTRIEMLPVDLSHAEINETLGQAGAYTDAVDRFIAGLVRSR